MKFTEFNLNSDLQKGIADAGYEFCMPVQEQVLLNGLEGSDLYVQSHTGSGKTAAFLITIFQRLLSDPELSGKTALVLVPTRELAVQVEEEARIIGAHLQFRTASFYGGVGYTRQQNQLGKGVDLMIGTPGRVIDLQESGTMKLDRTAFLVIDEADRMFDMGFYPDLRKLIRVLPPVNDRQTMLFSATLNSWVKNLAWEYTVDAKEITIETDNITVDEIEQLLFHVSSDEKMKLLLGLIRDEKPESMIIFCNTKRMTEVIAKRLRINGFETEFIIGDLPQSKRLQVIDSFKSGSLKYLVATDVAARGIDVDSLAMVVNYDLPNEAENYVHRIGRTARAGKTGKAYSFCSEQDVYNLPAIEKYIENKIPAASIADELFAADKSEGMYIRTEKYDTDYDDDRGSGRRPGGRDQGRRQQRNGPGRNERQEAGRRSGGNRAPDKRFPSAGPDRKKPGDDAGRYAKKGAASQNSRREYGDRKRSGEQDLSQLSFEERMTYYKNKYAAEGEPNPANKKNHTGGQKKIQVPATDKETDRSRRIRTDSIKANRPITENPPQKI
ncbi:DEAD/DEAH box helicase [Brucepastera parasyntrophica]|uniref:DEAD/DEAH box helicase n=1 Tax=Brucepastera parasyntrophica TaxID=2880008 RepID=UPI00210A260E|nr:DEAD/DEAH box helicase [Brucepastera parasyntrophica]ULQ60635.1 DEAD/DEAH box helicase [Brucepastera parasyntrophica]